jgi:hypothetical protein
MSAGIANTRATPALPRRQRPGATHALAGPAGRDAASHGRSGARTLAERLDLALERVRSAGIADCPVCRGPLVRGGPGGCCRACGSSVF